MNKHKWATDEVNYFVHLYKKHECLWNVKKASYASKPLREAAFADINEKMIEKKNLYGMGVNEIKEKIYNLRSTYYQLRKRYRYSSLCPSKCVGKWYKDMDFLVKRSRLNNKIGIKVDAKTDITLKPNEAEFLASSSTAFTLNGKNQDGTELLQTEMDQKVSERSTEISSVTLQSRIEIMNVFKKLLEERVTPNYSVMFDILTKIIKNSDDCHTRDIVGFIKEMTKLGFIYKEKKDGNKMIVENAEQRFERYFYLSKMGKLRANQNKPIIYIDERVINLQLKYEKFHNVRNELPPESSIFFLAITRDGFLSGLFSNEATEEQFNKWVTDILLGLLKTPSVVVMDNSPIHGKMEDTCSITRYSTRTEMLKWLIDNNIPCSPNIARPELFELIRRNKRDTKEYRIDRIIRSHGHEVLRLPYNFPDLNMTDVLWNGVADGSFAKVLKDTDSHTSIQMLQNTIIGSVLPSMNFKKWREMERILIMKENEIHQIDVAIENMLEIYSFI